MIYFFITLLILRIILSVVLGNIDKRKEIKAFTDKRAGNILSVTKKPNLVDKPGRLSFINDALKKNNLDFFVSNGDDGDIYTFLITTNNLMINVKVFERKMDNSLHMSIKNPILIPELKRRSIYEFLGSFNYFNSLTNFRMNPDEGNVILNSSLLYVPGFKLTADVISEWIRENCNVINRTFPCINAIAFGNAVPSQIWSKYRNGIDSSLN